MNSSESTCHRPEALLELLQGKLSDELHKAIASAETKTRLEDLYTPYRPKRRSKAQAAREAGLEPLADALLRHPERQPGQQAAAFVDPVGAVPLALYDKDRRAKYNHNQHNSRNNKTRTIDRDFSPDKIP